MNNEAEAFDAVLIISHGSRSEDAFGEVTELVRQLQTVYPDKKISAAFLELNDPSIPQGLSDCAAGGAKSIYVLPNFLNSGRHVKKDIPEAIEQFKKENPCVKVVLGTCIGQTAYMQKAYKAVIEELN